MSLEGEKFLATKDLRFRYLRLNEEVLGLRKWNNKIGIHRHDRDHERKRWENAEEPTLEESAERNFPRGDLLIDHGQADNKTRQHKKHVHANKTATEHSNAQMAQHH